MLEGIGRFPHARHGFCVVTLCHGKQDGNLFFAFVAIEPHNYSYFKKSYKRNVASNFSAFGLELLRGQGKQPEPDVVDFVRHKYNIEFNVDRRFIQRLITAASNPLFSEQDFSQSAFLDTAFLQKPAKALGS
jgi:hypothetical protein